MLKVGQRVTLNIERFERSGHVAGIVLPMSVTDKNVWINICFDDGTVGTYHEKNVKLSKERKKMIRNSCSNCKHSRVDNDKLICRRYPPRMLNIQRWNSISQSPEIGQIISFIPVEHDMFCGEWWQGKQKESSKTSSPRSPLVRG